MAKLVRVFHSVSTLEARAMVDTLTKRCVPLVWQLGEAKRVLNPKLVLRGQILVLLASSVGAVQVTDAQRWTEVKNVAHFRKTLRSLHKAWLIKELICQNGCSALAAWFKGIFANRPTARWLSHSASHG
jgi:hypothetical protein